MLFSRIRIHVPANEKGRAGGGELEKRREKVSVLGIRFRASKKKSLVFQELCSSKAECVID